MVHSPHISVILSVYNGETYLRHALDSLRAQTFTDYELILLNDGSTDSSPAIIQAYASQDDRIRVLAHPQRLGLAKSLNQGIAAAHGELLARMDADDLSLPDRFEQQVRLLHENPGVDVVSGWIAYMDETGALTGSEVHYPGSPLVLRWYTFLNNPLAHPAVMARRRFYEQFSYDESVTSAQDYELWTRANDRAWYANVQKVVLHYRTHPGMVSMQQGQAQEANALSYIQRSLRKYLGKQVPIEVVRLMRSPYRSASLRHYLAALAALRALERKYRQEHRLQPAESDEIRERLAGHYRQIAAQNPQFRLSRLLRAYADRLARQGQPHG